MVDLEKVERATRMLLEGLGEDPERPGLAETPRRVARMWEELVAGMDQSAEEIMKAITVEDYDELILLRDIPLVACASITSCCSSAGRMWPICRRRDG